MNKPDFSESLLIWYDNNKRSLPWRNTNNPYFIWVSEIMLQQTRVQAVQPFFEKFILRFPDMQSLAEGDEQELLKYWQGLGYYRRVHNMQKAAKMICQNFGGVIPAKYEELLALPGIGAYTAAAISSIAFEQKHAVMDGNVMRISARIFALHTDILQKSTQKLLQDNLQTIFPNARFGDFNQAMMELGSLVCLPQNPRCEICPVQSFCEAYQKNLQFVIPLRESQTKVIKIKRYLFIIECDEQFLLTKRPNYGLLANFWEFPGVEAKTLHEANLQLRQLYQSDVSKPRFLFSYQHVFSHRIWQVRVYHAQTHLRQNGFSFFSRDELLDLALPTAFKKVRDFILEMLIR
jgi:A/G-specific adenine glycosylase